MASSKLADVHVDDIGTEFRGRLIDVNAPYDPTLADSKILRFATPDGTVIPVPATVVAVSPDWYLVFVTTDTSLSSVPGIWKYQGRVVMPDGKSFTTSEIWYRVVENL